MSKMTERIRLPSLGFKKKNLKDDASAAVVLGVESVPDGLASGLLAGVNPVAGLYAYMYGVAGAALFTSTAFMAVQGTGAMAIIIADVDLDATDDPTRALVTLSLLTGAVMMVAGFLRLGSLVRFVSNSVMVGFISAVGLNIVLGQVGDFTGYDSDAAGRVGRTIDTIIHPWRMDVWTVVVGVATIVLIIGLRRTRLGAMGMVVAIVLGSALAAVFLAFDKEVALVRDVAEVPNRLPAPALPLLSEIPYLIIPALSLAFVGLVQGAGVSAAFVNPDGSQGDESKDFVGQGAGNIASGFFTGTPVGGSMSATSLVTSAGAKSRWALIFASMVMAVVILVFAGAVELIAMPALAGLLIVVGFETIKVDDIVGVYKTGPVQAVVMIVTFILTLLIPLQYAVLVGVGMSMILYVIRQANQLETFRLVLDDDGGVDEVGPPDDVGPHEVIILQPYGSLFFAAAPVFREHLPDVTENSVGSVVILRLRGKPDVGSTLIDVLVDYSESLRERGSKLMIVTTSDRIIEQLHKTGAAEAIGESNLYRSEPRLLATVSRAARDAAEWVDERRGVDPTRAESRAGTDDGTDRIDPPDLVDDDDPT